MKPDPVTDRRDRERRLVSGKRESGTTHVDRAMKFTISVASAKTSTLNSRVPRLETARVLVVDDDAFALDFFTTALSAHGYDTLRAIGPGQALDIVKSQPPVDVVLSDIDMPGMRGPALISEIARVSPQAAFVLMTAGGVDPSELPPAVPLLHKPFHVSDLIAAVEDAIA